MLLKTGLRSSYTLEYLRCSILTKRFYFDIVSNIATQRVLHNDETSIQYCIALYSIFIKECSIRLKIKLLSKITSNFIISFKKDVLFGLFLELGGEMASSIILDCLLIDQCSHRVKVLLPSIIFFVDV